MNYGFLKKVAFDIDTTLKRVQEVLKNEGFGILTKIDVEEKFKEKLDIEFPRYKILGACNPEMAYKAISAEWEIGLLLPCNVIIYEKEGDVFVGIIRPTRAMAEVKNETLQKIASEVEEKLKRVFESI